MEGEKGQHLEEVQKAESLQILGRERVSMHYCDLFVVNERGEHHEGAGEPSEILVLSVKSCQILYPAIFVASTKLYIVNHENARVCSWMKSMHANTPH